MCNAVDTINNNIHNNIKGIDVIIIAHRCVWLIAAVRQVMLSGT
jgi:hypothetical protein